MEIQNLIKYYNQCYQEDNIGTRIIDVFSKNIENKYFFEGEDQLINGFLPYAPIDSAYAEETAKKIKINERDKELVYCSLFIAGNSNSETTDSKNICSPLLIYPAEIININDDYFVKIDYEHRRINFGVFSEIVDEQKNLPEFHEELYKIIENNPVELSMISQISKLLEKYSSSIDTSVFLAFPELLSKKELQGVFKRKVVTDEGKFMAVQASVIAIIKKSVNTRGIINELNALSIEKEFSEPIKTIFGNQEFNEKNKGVFGHVPAILNLEQEHILSSVEQYPFSVIIGPPGTGKSYTLAALAIEKMSKGKSVLIAASTDKAVDVIADKIEKQLNLNNIIVRTGRNSYKQNLINYVNEILRMRVIEGYKKESHITLRHLKATERRSNKVQRLFKTRIDEELKWGKYIAENQDKKGFFVNLKKRYISFRNEKSENHWDIEEEMQALFVQRADLINKFIQQKYGEDLNELVRNDLKSVNTFLSAISSIRIDKQQEYFLNLNFESIFKIFPIWMVKMSEVYRYLPLVKDLFDYVIIDEATQSNVSQAIPILQRGKNAIITGDPKQLRHFSFLSAAKQNIFRDKFGLNGVKQYMLDYKNNSLLDILSESTRFAQQFSSLNEHFRSLPAIINFSNKTFYDGKLKIMSSRPDLDHNLGIQIINCEGIRTKKGYNKEEAEKILELVIQIITDEEKLNTDVCSSIGILSPFRDQVDYITSLVTKELSYEQIQKHQISINTAYGFQGDERDIMFISFAVDDKTNATAIRYLDKDDVFNVSVTRARKLQYILYSVDYKNLKHNNLLRRYLESFVPKEYAETEQKFHDEFMEDVKKELVNDGFEIWCNYQIAGLNIDLVIKKNDTIIGIDLIGFPGQFSEAFTIERYKMLNRAGLDTFPLPYTYWFSDKENCISEINEAAV